MECERRGWEEGEKEGRYKGGDRMKEREEEEKREKVREGRRGKMMEVVEKKIKLVFKTNSQISMIIVTPVY